ncbi:helix-hairpin-helix domain-containing protein [Streptomyces chartreusis]|uniref:helix-hairpin-helix domain-containing protein n=1 Tax=Streptomyces chartreusis TaxID=1969 RepID=UPI0036C63091
MPSAARGRTATVTSGPGRGPRSDGRTRHRRGTHVTGRARQRQRHASAEELRRRAEVIFAERGGEWGESGEPGVGPPPRRSGVEGVGRGFGLDPDVDRDRDREPDPDLARGGVVAGAGLEDGSAAGREDGSRAGWEDAPGAASYDGGGAAGVGGDAGGRAGAGDADLDAGAGSGEWRARAGLALRERMPVWLQARCGLERRNVVALTVVLVLAAGFAVQHFWAGRAQSVRAPEVVRAAAPYGGGEPGGEQAGEPGSAASGTGASTAGASAAGAPGAVGTSAPEIVVDVGGKVREPGIHRLPAGSRVADALRAAGGVRPGTNTDTLNRARFLVDGEQVVVGAPAAPAPEAGAGTGVGGAAAPGAAPAAPIPLNTATVDQLDTLPGVGPVLAQHIIDYRTQHGGFRSVDELREVNGIGDRRFADLRNLVRP